jgi:hypothetical protein
MEENNSPSTFTDDSNAIRGEIKYIAGKLKYFIEETKNGGHSTTEDVGEMIANLMLSYRHLEDASMRIGKAMRAYDEGVSVYDKDTTVGA